MERNKPTLILAKIINLLLNCKQVKHQNVVNLDNKQHLNITFSSLILSNLIYVIFSLILSDTLAIPSQASSVCPILSIYKPSYLNHYIKFLSFNPYLWPENLKLVIGTRLVELYFNSVHQESLTPSKRYTSYINLYISLSHYDLANTIGFWYFWRLAIRTHIAFFSTCRESLASKSVKIFLIHLKNFSETILGKNALNVVEMLTIPTVSTFHKLTQIAVCNPLKIHFSS